MAQFVVNDINGAALAALRCKAAAYGQSVESLVRGAIEEAGQNWLDRQAVADEATPEAVPPAH